MTKHKGFTIVELLIVIIVIGILAGITIVTYSFVRSDAVDTKIRSVVKTVGDAVSLYEGQNPTATVVADGLFTVTDGVDSLVPKYLKTGYRDGLTSKKSSDVNQIFRYYRCVESGAGGRVKGHVVYAALNNPSADDIANFNKVKAECNHSDSQVPVAGSIQYNYAQMF